MYIVCEFGNNVLVEEYIDVRSAGEGAHGYRTDGVELDSDDVYDVSTDVHMEA